MAERLNETVPLLSTTRFLLREAEELTGTPIELKPVSVLPNDARASLRLPRGTRHHYIIRYSERYKRHLDHLIPHELGHLRRLLMIPDDRRDVPVSTRTTRNNAACQLERETDQLKSDGASETLVNNLVPVWTEGCIAQLTNFPADMRIEHEIRSQPALRTAQESSLLEQVLELKRTLTLEVARYTPPTIYRNSLTMNYVLVRRISELMDRNDLLKPFEQVVNIRLGKELYSLATEGHDRGYWDDRVVITLWAQKLGMTDWFEWRNTKEIEHWPDSD